MRPIRTAALAAALLSCSAHVTPRPVVETEESPSLQLPDGVRPVHYSLDLEVVPTRPTFRGKSQIAVDLAEPRSHVWMHGRDLRVTRATVEVAAGDVLCAEFTQVNRDGVVRLAFPRPVGPGRVTLRFEWDAAWGTKLVGLYLTRGGDAVYAATQLHAMYARRVFPSFDEPRFKTPFDVKLTVLEDAVAVANAPEVGAEPAANGLRRVRFATTPPLPTYLVFFAAGPFDVVAPPPLPPNEVREEPLAIRGLAPRGHGAELAFAMEVTAAMVPWFERYFGIPHPYAKLDQIALPDFMWRGMENAGAIAYREQYLLASEATPDAARRLVAVLIAHEISHQWFGNLVTLPWWTDAWLNEAFATWIGGRAVSRWRPEWNLELLSMRLADDLMELDSVGASRAIRQPLRSMDEVDGQFDGMSYFKGGALLASFERLLGEEHFREGVRRYLRSHLHGTGSASSLYAALSTAAGQDVAPAFSSFTDTAGVPLLSARVACDSRGARLLLAQSRWLPRGSNAPPGNGWHVPFCVRWDAAGKVQDGCTMVGGGEDELPLGSECPTWVMPHAGATSYHRWSLPPAELASLRAALHQLTAAEKVSLVRNMRAAQQAGTIPWPIAMELIGAVATDPDPEVSIEPIAILSLADDRLVPEAARPALRAWARARYGPVLARIGWEARAGESAAMKRLRAAVVDLLALEMDDVEVRREAARRGAAFAGLDGSPPRSASVDADLVEVALAAAIRERGAPAFDALLGWLGRSEDAALRPQLVGALGREHQTSVGAPLWQRPEIRPHERAAVLDAMGARRGGREVLLGALEQDAGAVLGSLPPLRLSQLPHALSRACELRDAERLRVALEPRLGEYPQIARSLAQSVEQIRICAAEREADGAAAGAFFAQGMSQR